MQLITPGIGLLFWMVVSFGIVLYILGKFAWKPIMNALKERENNIHKALSSADNARKDMEKLKAENDEIMAKARMERDILLKEAREMREKLISDAKTLASEEASKLLENTRKTIEIEKSAALKEIRDQVVTISIDIAEKIMREKLSVSGNQHKLIDEYLNEMNL